MERVREGKRAGIARTMDQRVKVRVALASMDQDAKERTQKAKARGERTYLSVPFASRGVDPRLYAKELAQEEMLHIIK